MEKRQSEKPHREGSKARDLPAAGPHDKPELQDEMKTPGTGALNKPGSQSDGAGSE